MKLTELVRNGKTVVYRLSELPLPILSEVEVLYIKPKIAKILIKGLGESNFSKGNPINIQKRWDYYLKHEECGAETINSVALCLEYIRPFKQSGYLFGTDDKGNSLFNALWAGTKNSLFLAVMATLITEFLGVVIGMFWGFSKKIDAVMIEVYNVLSNIPTTLIAMILVYALGAGMKQLIFALCITTWVSTAYFIRVQVMIIRDREYNLASKCLGTPTYKIILNNVLPYLVSVIITSISRDIPLFISTEVALSYMGVGLSEEIPSLGKMIQQYAPYMTSASYLFWIPVFTAAIVSVSLYIVGQALADASDPRTHML